MTEQNGTVVAEDGIHARFKLDYPGFTLDVDLKLPGRGVTSLFGHSGSGKTTCLRCIAGLENAPDGFLEINGERWQDSAAGVFVPAHKRAVGYVFQDANLFPHLNVRKNLEYGMRRVPEASRKVAWDQALNLLGIDHLLERRPDTLSGGERQRVGMARALLTSPRLLLMDEPLAALDLKLKREILPYLERLHDELDIPVLYVSHAPDEVGRIADHIVLLDHGRSVAEGPLVEVLARLDIPTAFTDDAGVVIEATIAVQDDEYDLTRLDFPGGSVWVGRRDEPLGRKIRFRVNASDVSLATQRQEGSSIVNLLPATVEEVVTAEHPAFIIVRLSAAGTPLLARITRRSCDQLGVALGQPLWAQIKSVALLA